VAGPELRKVSIAGGVSVGDPRTRRLTGTDQNHVFDDAAIGVTVDASYAF
jgi:hypothetical protein